MRLSPLALAPLALVVPLVLAFPAVAQVTIDLRALDPLPLPGQTPRGPGSDQQAPRTQTRPATPAPRTATRTPTPTPPVPPAAPPAGPGSDPGTGPGSASASAAPPDTAAGSTAGAAAAPPAGAAPGTATAGTPPAGTPPAGTPPAGTQPAPGAAGPTAAQAAPLPIVTPPPATLSAIPPPPVAAAAPPPPPVSATATARAEPTAAGMQVLFEPAATDLSPASLAAIRQFAAGAPNADGVSFNVLAYAAGKSDDPSVARRLSLSRALAVRAALVAEGVASSRIYVRALGHQAGGGPPDRVDISLLGANAAQPR